MSKLDFTKIEGFDKMSDAEKLQAIANYEFNDNSDELERAKQENARLKASFDKTASELAKAKKDYSSRLSDQEKLEQERAEKEKATLEELNALRTEKRVLGYKAKLMSSGFDEATASKMANNLPDGISDEFFSGITSQMESTKARLKEEMYKGQPDPSKGQPPKQPDFNNMSDKEYYAYLEEQKKQK